MALETYRKIRFYNTRLQESTAGFIITESQYKDSTITELSRLFPYSEARKMAIFQVSPEYLTFEEAFLHQFVD